MNTYIVVKHKSDNSGSYSNEWLDEYLLKTITTDFNVSQACEEAKINNKEVYIYRCAYGGSPALISCKCKVERIDSISKNSFMVTFKEQVMLDVEPYFEATQGKNIYKI